MLIESFISRAVLKPGGLTLLFADDDPFQRFFRGRFYLESIRGPNKRLQITTKELTAMLVQNFRSNSPVNFRSANQAKPQSAAFEPAAQTDLVEIGRSVQEQDRFIDLGPVGKVIYGGIGTAVGAVGGGIAWAAGATGWALPAAAAGCGLIGAVIGHFAVDSSR